MAGRSGLWLDVPMLAAFNPVLLFLPLIVLMPVLLFWLVRKQARKNREGLAVFAAETGLRLTERTVLGCTTVERLDGEQSGRPVRYWSFATGSGKSRTNWVAVGVEVPAGVALQFELTRQNFGSKIMELFGVREIQVGDPAFDAAWFVRTNQPEFFAAALVPAIRARFMAETGAGRAGSFKLEAGMVRYAEMGGLSPDTARRLAAKLPLLHDLADVADVSVAPRA